MTRYFMVRLGRQGIFLSECLSQGFIGVDYGINEDLSGKFPTEWRAFNAAYIPVWMANHPDKSKVAAGLACAAMWTVGEHIRVDEYILSPNASGTFRVGRVAGPYRYAPDSPLPHQRPVEWLPESLERSEFSESLRKATNSALTVVNLSAFSEELRGLIEGDGQPVISVSDELVEDPATFALERHLEDFLVANWAGTILGKTYDIYSEDGELLGQQFPTDTGRIDILAISKDRKELLVVELKRGRASDAVVGQIQRYMGYIKEELLEPDQQVRGVIVALDDDVRIRRALAVTQGIDFYRYEVSFRLLPS
jgi:restriction system protein